FGVNAVDWLSQEEDLMAIRSKVRAPAPLRAESESEKRIIQLVNVYGIPALVALIGIVVLWRRRRNARRVWNES
ncbi:ABC transporter, partial [Candidatus Pacearchaeota archaeon]